MTTMNARALVALILALRFAEGFHVPFTVSSTRRSSVAAGDRPRLSPLIFQSKDDHNSKVPIIRRVLDRFDTTTAAGIEDAKGAGVLKRIKGLHGPITYLALALIAGLKWKWCFRSPYYWFGVAFCVKWYRARYVFKIPVWDRQPNWNNIITSKEQEKDLKAFTCKQCGSTLFIAKTREFFFEGNTGIGGLGCFSCGAKGKENFDMDRDRILEDVADMDDYFEYERPLDFVSRAERRKVLTEAGGDEEKANQLLVDRAATESGAVADQPTTTADSPTDQPPSEEETNTVNGDDIDSSSESSSESVLEEFEVDEREEESASIDAATESEVTQPTNEIKADETKGVSPETEVAKAVKSDPAPKKTPTKSKPKPLPTPTEINEDDLDALDMDAF